MFLVPSLTQHRPSNVCLLPPPRSQVQVHPPHRKSSSFVSRSHETRILVLTEISPCPQVNRDFHAFSQFWFSAPFSFLGFYGFPFVSFTLGHLFEYVRDILFGMLGVLWPEGSQMCQFPCFWNLKPPAMSFFSYLGVQVTLAESEVPTFRARWPWACIPALGLSYVTLSSEETFLSLSFYIIPGFLVCCKDDLYSNTTQGRRGQGKITLSLFIRSSNTERLLCVRSIQVLGITDNADINKPFHTRVKAIARKGHTIENVCRD